MAGRSRRFSSTSVDESEDRESRIRYTPERAALKPVAKTLDPDDWPCYVLEDTTIYLKGGGTIGNLLHAELGGSYVVRGRLAVDEEWHSRLINKKYNGHYIEVQSCKGFSIGSGPITLWALGQSGWLEIRPSERYQKMYNTMAEAITIYYFVTDLYEETKQKAQRGSRITLSIDKILLKYAIHEGTGLVRSEVVKKMKSHAEFLLSQMRKGESIAWRSTIFFKWLSGECPEIYTRLLKKSGESVVPQSRIPLADLPTPIPQVPPPPPPPISKTLPHHTRAPILPPTRPDPTPPSSTSTPTSDCSTLPEAGAPLPTILTLMAASDVDGRGSSTREKMTLSKLGTLFYYKYSLKSASLSQEIIKAHAKAILSSLGPEWKETPIYSQLSSIAKRAPPKNDDLRDQAMAITEVKRRREAASFRKLPQSGSYGRSSASSSLQREASSQSLDPSPEPHASKSLLPPHGGRRSGKVAGLRLAGGPAMKRDASPQNVSSGDDTSRPRKRRRPSPPEMGDDSDSSPPLSVGVFFFNSHSSPETGEDSDNDDEEDTLTALDTKVPVPLKLVMESLPTLSPSGPNGAWTCDRKDCIFVVSDANSEEGTKKIKEHYNEHADRLERESLARQEAVQCQHPIDHLLEKLRGLGEASKIEDMVAMIGGRVVPGPIKRKSGMAV